ncbi:NADPH oxidase organizer 1-like [Hyperolius riggenbachi]|uniref:NADPH oxidase organizer 1-like n=1 Tax=Hyperolius riggenbachi TaxID=752182 RepID=UPI0035A34A23
MRQDSISRHPVEVEAIGLLQHDKKNAYMFSVLWSDQNKLLIYRTFREFKRFQRDLKKKFPLEAGAVNKSERTLPKLKDASLPLGKRRDTKWLLERLQKLESYSQMLLKLDAKVSQCDIVVQFFTLKNHDINPSFPDNSLVIMPSEKIEEKSIASPLTPDISGPVISISYRCVADYETVDLRNKPFRVKRHDMLDVLLKERTGWWLVENEDRMIAWFPAPYLQEDGDSDISDSATECQEEGTLCVVVKAYEAQNSDELSVSIGVVVKVLKKSDNGWWLASYNRRTGYVPSLYLKSYSNPCEKFQNILGKQQFVSTPNLLNRESFGDAYSLLQQRSSLGGLPINGSSLGNRGRTTSLDSEARSERESDSDAIARDNSRRNSSCSENSSLNASSPSLSESSSPSAQPKIPARPKADEILLKCSTITKRSLQRSLASMEISDLPGTHL